MIAILGLYCILLVPFIKFPQVVIYQDYFEIKRTSIIKKLSKSIRYYYEDVNEILFLEGYNNWGMIIISFLFSFLGEYSSEVQNSKQDSMILKLNSDKIIEINRIGKREDFKKLIEQLQSKLSNL